MSVGALNDEFLSRLREIAKSKGRKIYIPSGAVVGIDGIKAVSDRISEVMLITRKNPKSFGLNFSGVIFEGNAKKLFPRNLNIANC